MSLQQSIAKALLEINAVKLSPSAPFTWASGLKSPIYCDNRIILSSPNIRNLVISGMQEVVSSNFSFDGIAGVATAGIPHGALLSDRMDLPFIYVRSKAKSHGRTNIIEGDITKMKEVIVVEDLISTGGSSLEAVQRLQQAGLKVVGVVAIFSYGFELATEKFGHASIPFVTLTDYPTLLEVAKSINYIEQSEIETLKSWSKDPRKWSENR
jgi:orotate phosphoribosyltransferase (EC 2.4.2.10)